MEFEDLQKLAFQDKYHYSSHADEKMAERNISDEQVKRAFLGGEVLETYKEDIRGKCYLVLGEGPVHLLVGYNRYRELAIIITAYIPGFPKWISPTERG